MPKPHRPIDHLARCPAWALIFCVSMLAPLHAAVITMNDGTILKGKIDKADRQYVWISLAAAQSSIRLPKTDIQSVELGENESPPPGLFPPADPSTTRQAKPYDLPIDPQWIQLEQQIAQHRRQLRADPLNPAPAQQLRQLLHQRSQLQDHATRSLLIGLLLYLNHHHQQAETAMTKAAACPPVRALANQHLPQPLVRLAEDAHLKQIPTPADRNQILQTAADLRLAMLKVNPPTATQPAHLATHPQQLDNH